MSDKDNAVQRLHDLYIKNGFVTSNEVYEICDELDISLFDTDYVMKKITNLGILVTDDATIADGGLKARDELIDYAQVDYNKIYNYFLSNYPAMKIVVDIAKNASPIQHGEANQLIIQIRSGNNHARDILFRKFIRVALRIAYNYRKKTTISLEDIFQEACMSILKAIELYNPYEHPSFTAYCSTWIMQGIDRYIADHESFIRIPIHAQEQIKIIEKIVSKHYYIGDYEIIKLINNSTSLSYGEAANALVVLKLKENNYLYDFFETLDEINIMSNDNVEEQVENNLQTEKIFAVLESLTDREKDVICMRYGLISGCEYTLEEIGNKMNVTRERIRQIEAKALRKLRHPSSHLQEILLIFDF